jgi:hypothetical protein
MFADAHAPPAKNAQIKVAVYKRLRTLYPPVMIKRRNRQLRQTQVIRQNPHLAKFLVIAGMTACSSARFFCFRPIFLTELTFIAN